MLSITHHNMLSNQHPQGCTVFATSTLSVAYACYATLHRHATVTSNGKFEQRQFNSRCFKTVPIQF